MNDVRGDLRDRNCPSRIVLDHLSSRWGTLVLRALLGGTRRFGELRREVDGVSEKMLTQTLQALERDGLVHRRAYPVIPPRVEYRLTELGREAATWIDGLLGWIEDAMPEIGRRQSAHDSSRAEAIEGPSSSEMTDKRADLRTLATPGHSPSARPR